MGVWRVVSGHSLCLHPESTIVLPDGSPMTRDELALAEGEDCNTEALLHGVDPAPIIFLVVLVALFGFAYKVGRGHPIAYVRGHFSRAWHAGRGGFCWAASAVRAAPAPAAIFLGLLAVAAAIYFGLESIATHGRYR